MITLPLSRGLVALIDDEDAHLAAFKWSALVAGNGRAYAVRMQRRTEAPRPRMLYLHREVLGVNGPRPHVDHVNGDGLDCRRPNLRLATHQQNQANRRRDRTNTSGYKGVSWHATTGRWSAYVIVAGRKKHLGLFATREEAAAAYNAAARSAFGDYSLGNVFHS